MPVLRIDKIIADSGKASRKEAKALIKSGRVTAYKNTVTSADMKYDPEMSEICIDGIKIEYAEKYYFMMNKPAGYVTSTSDPRDETVLELVPKKYSHLNLFSAGRLDKDSEGLLILTDDGEYCHNIISPKKCVYKKYYVQVQGKLNGSDTEEFKKGISLNSGVKFLPGALEIIDETSAYAIIREGKYHQIKRMFEYLNKSVVYLKRVSIGGLELDNKLKTGETRRMSKEEACMVFVTSCITSS